MPGWRSGAAGAFAWLIAGVAAIAFGRRRGSPEMAWVVALLVFADLWFAGNGWNPSIRPERALPSAPLALREVREAATPTRVAGIGDVLPPNTGVYLGLQDIRGYDVPVIEGYHRFFREALRGRDTWWVYELPSFDASALPFYDLANVEWVLSRSELPLPLAAEGSSGVRVYRNPSALPRARLVERAEFVADGEAALARVLELGDGLRDVVVLEGPIPSAEAPPGAETGAAPATAGEAAPGEASVVRYEARRVEVEVRTPAPAWLVLSDSAYPGWRARIDGEETPIRRADSLFRAVRVPAGVHRVDFTYTPWSVRAGVLVSLVCTGIALWLWIRER